MTIDGIDKKIIGLLFEDSRKSFSDIAQEVDVSKNAAWTRYNKLCKSEIITGATVQINYKKLGYEAVATLLLDVANPNLNEVSQYISKRIPDVFGPFVSHSIYNLRAVVTLKTLHELGEIKEELRKLAGVSEVNSSIWTDVWFTPENLSFVPIRPVEGLETSSDNNIRSFNADQLDLKIIDKLATDSRIPFRTMAKQLDVSIDTVTRRYEKLKKEHIIVPRIQINPNKLGYTATVHYHTKVLPNFNTINLIAEMFSMQNAFYFMKCSGEYNIGIMVMVKELVDIFRSADFITQVTGVKRVETIANPIGAKWPLSRTYTSTLSKCIP
jgi:DNA-binding Lrp family transcriptional regulator